MSTRSEKHHEGSYNILYRKKISGGKNLTNRRRKKPLTSTHHSIAEVK